MQPLAGSLIWLIRICHFMNTALTSMQMLEMLNFHCLFEPWNSIFNGELLVKVAQICSIKKQQEQPQTSIQFFGFVR